MLLKAQLHPHFLFNTLNNIYGMSLTGNKETPSFILRLSDMMRFILYDCQRNLGIARKRPGVPGELPRDGKAALPRRGYSIHHQW